MRAQSGFNARDTFTGRLDAGIVRQAVEDIHTEDANPGVRTSETPLRSDRIQERAESHLWELNQTHLDGFQEESR